MRILKTLQPFLWVLPAALLLLLHFHRLAEVPGLHFDEAWALNYSWRIAFEKGFFPLSAMSPYTAPWAHYWAAAWFYLGGASLFVFRASQVVLSLAGLGFLCLALPRAQRTLFLFFTLLMPTLAFNHRFAIELNGLHAFAFGLFAFALTRRIHALAMIAALLGTTGHILFYAVPLATLALPFLGLAKIEAKARGWAAAYFALMCLFFLRVAFEIPEKGKAAALAASAALACAGVLLYAESWLVWRSPWWKRSVILVASLFVWNLVFFAVGGWSLAIQGGDPYWGVAAALIAPFLLLFTFLVMRQASEPLAYGFLCLCAALGLMMLKPAPRYFELALLLLPVLWASVLEKRKNWGAGEFLFMLLLLPVLTVSQYFSYWGKPPVEQELRVLFFKDSSRDFLDKQSLAKFLGGSACAASDIHTTDPRLKESFQALAYGDWPVAPGVCQWNIVSRRSEGTALGEPYGEFLLRRKP